MYLSRRRRLPQPPARVPPPPVESPPCFPGWLGSTKHVGSGRAAGPPGSHPGGLSAAAAARDARPQPPHGGGEENHPGRHGSAEERRGEGAVGAQVRTQLHLPASLPALRPLGGCPAAACAPGIAALLPAGGGGAWATRAAAGRGCFLGVSAGVRVGDGGRRGRPGRGWRALGRRHFPRASFVISPRATSAPWPGPGSGRTPAPRAFLSAAPPPPRGGSDWGDGSNMAVHRCSRPRPRRRRAGRGRGRRVGPLPRASAERLCPQRRAEPSCPRPRRAAGRRGGEGPVPGGVSGGCAAAAIFQPLPPAGSNALRPAALPVRGESICVTPRRLPSPPWPPLGTLPTWGSSVSGAHGLGCGDVAAGGSEGGAGRGLGGGATSAPGAVRPRLGRCPVGPPGARFCRAASPCLTGMCSVSRPL